MVSKLRPFGFMAVWLLSGLGSGTLVNALSSWVESLQRMCDMRRVR